MNKLGIHLIQLHRNTLTRVLDSLLTRLPCHQPHVNS